MLCSSFLVSNMNKKQVLLPAFSAFVLFLIVLCGLTKLFLLPRDQTLDNDESLLFFNDNTTFVVGRLSACDNLKLFNHLEESNKRIYTETFSLIAHYNKAYRCYFHSHQKPILPIKCHTALKAFTYFCNDSTAPATASYLPTYVSDNSDD